MAIMKRCCCFSNTRSGSTAASVFNLIYGILFIAFTGWGFLIFSGLGGIVATMFYVQFAMYALLALVSIISMVGICKDSGALLMPHIVTLALMMLLEFVSYIIWLSQLGFAAIVLIIPFVMFLIFLTLNILCLLCLISQYQEYKAGRGRACDVEAAQVTHTTVVVAGGGTVMTGQQPGAPGTFVVQQSPGMMVQQNPGMMVQQSPGMMVQQSPGMMVQAPPPQYDQQNPNQPDIKTY